MSATLSLSAARSRRLRLGLEDVRRAADLRHAALVHESGIVIAESGDGSCHDRGELGALATGAFFAARELARRIGDAGFSGLHYDGRDRHFFITALGAEAFLFCVFGNETRLAVVRACVLRAVPTLTADLSAPDTEPVLPGDLALGDYAAAALTTGLPPVFAPSPRW